MGKKAILTAAATLAVGEALESATTKDKISIAGAFVNHTPFIWELKEKLGAPSSGAWAKAPLREVIPYNENETEEDTEWHKKCHSTFSLYSTAFLRGAEGIVVYRASLPNNNAINVTLLIDHPYKGAIKAGVSISSDDWINNQDTDKLIDHIHNIHTVRCKRSEGEPLTVEDDYGNWLFTVKFQAADKTIFEITCQILPIAKVIENYGLEKLAKDVDIPKQTLSEVKSVHQFTTVEMQRLCKALALTEEELKETIDQQ